MSFDLFGGDLSPAPVPQITAHIPGIETMCPETQQALGAMVKAVWKAADEGRLAPNEGSILRRIGSEGRLPRAGFDVNLLAFVAQARRHGHTDPSLTPIAINEAGRRIFDEQEVIRFANELLRGVRSDRPSMTPERWREAIAKAREARP